MSYYNGTTLISETTFDFQYCDFLGNVKPSAIMKAFSDLAGEDYTNRGFSYDVLMSMDLAFLISKVNCEIYENIKRNQKVVLSTYEKQRKGGFFIRNYSIATPEGKILIEAKAQWILIKPSTRQLLRPSDLPTPFLETDKDVSCREPKRLRMEGFEKVGERKVVYSDLDGNAHIFNPIYLDIAMDFLPIETLQENELSGFEIYFSHEAKHGETLEIFVKQEENVSKVYGTLGDTQSFSSEIRF